MHFDNPNGKLNKFFFVLRNKLNKMNCTEFMHCVNVALPDITPTIESIKLFVNVLKFLHVHIKNKENKLIILLLVAQRKVAYGLPLEKEPIFETINELVQFLKLFENKLVQQASEQESEDDEAVELGYLWNLKRQ